MFITYLILSQNQNVHFPKENPYDADLFSFQFFEILWQYQINISTGSLLDILLY